MSPDRLAEPWRSFLADVDAAIRIDVALVCLGGFAVTLFYGLTRPTADIDVCDVVPHEAVSMLIAVGGAGSPLHRRHGVHLQLSRVAQLPDDYEARRIPVFVETFERLRLFVLDPYDLALSKIERNADQDLEDVKHLARSIPFDLAVLRRRYESELRPYLGRPERDDLTLQLWLDAITEERGPSAC